MIATIVNCASILIGSAIGFVFKKSVHDEAKHVVFTSIGLMTFVIGFSMALNSSRILFLTLSLVLGGVLGHALHIEKGILKFGEFLKGIVAKEESESTRLFAQGFLDASVLFCVGAMAIVGSFQAGAEGSYDLLFTKSVLDGFMAILFTAAMGLGVAFSAITVLIYQGVLTLLASYIRPYVSELLLTEISACGGVLIIMIGFNLLELRKIKTANFLPALIFMVLFIFLEPLLELIPIL
ncbi:MAG: DUF554 domain-containing protein [Spirochaetia bacterium]